MAEQNAGAPSLDPISMRSTAPENLTVPEPWAVAEQVSTGTSGVHPLVGPNARAKTRILVVDDEHTMRESCATLLRLEGYDVTVCGRGEEARDLLKRRLFDVALVDLYMSHVDGLTLVQTAVEAHPGVLVIVMTGNPSIESSIAALRAGAWDYLPKPFSAAQLQVLVGRAAHTLLVSRETPEPKSIFPDRPVTSGDRLSMLGSSPAFRTVIELARKVAPTDASVFITGESGCGKELVAHFIHQHSRRASRPFVALNCAALPEMLLESEMFGHRKGAFTGAVRDKPGLLETANGGTLLLDELIDMPKGVQAKLLRVIQDGVVRRVGSEETDAVVNVRFIAAMNSDPDAAMQRGELREDLYYRLRVVPIHIPPLRERAEDIPLIANHFLATFWKRRRETGSTPPTFTPEALRALSEHPWRGNARELQNVIEHVSVLAEPGSAVDVDQLPLRSPALESADGPGAEIVSSVMEEAYHPARDRVIAQFELHYLKWLLKRAGGNMSEAARIGGVDRTTLYRLMDRHGLQREPHSTGVVERTPPRGNEPPGEKSL
jgi:DNA-binding NtrC family response regulator